MEFVSFALFSRPKICSSSLILASSFLWIHDSLKWDEESLRRQFNDCNHIAQVIKQMLGFNLSLNI